MLKAETMVHLYWLQLLYRTGISYIGQEAAPGGLLLEEDLNFSTSTATICQLDGLNLTDEPIKLSQ